MDVGTKAMYYIANELNMRDQQGPYVRWLCLREDLQQKYLAEARLIVTTWWADELWAQTAREKK